MTDIQRQIESLVQVRTRFKIKICALALAAITFLLAPGDSAAQAPKPPLLLSPPQALASLYDNRLTLIDIRTPGEIARTGIAAGATALDWRKSNFIAEVEAALGGDRSKPVALICARGVRSSYAAQLLIENGFTAVADIREGMLGSGGGPGWIRRGLPVTGKPAK